MYIRYNIATLLTSTLGGWLEGVIKFTILYAQFILICPEYEVRKKIYQNKRPMGHIAHLRNQVKSINTFEQSYDYVITLIGRRKKPHYLLFENWMLISCKTLSPFLQTMLCVKFGSGEDSENMKSLQTDGRTDGWMMDDRQLEKLTWAFSSDELKIMSL